MAHLIYVQAKDTKKFNYVKFGTYKLRNGKTSVLLNPDDVAIDGWEMHDAHVTLDIDDVYDKRIYEFLKEHPFIRQDKHYRLIDTKARVQKQAEQILTAADAVQIATKLEEKELKDLAKLTGIGTNFDNEIIKAKIIQLAAKAPEKFLKIYNDADKDYRVFLKNAENKKIIQKVNDVWKHGNYTLGISDEHAIAWLKDNTEVYAVMKNQLRGNIEVKVEDVVDTSDMMASEGVSMLEKEVEKRKKKSN